MTIIGVFHDLGLLRRLADRVVVMDRRARPVTRAASDEVEHPPVRSSSRSLHPVSEQQRSIAITNAVVVLPDRVLERGAVGMRDGLIAEIAEAAVLQGDYDDEIDAARRLPDARRHRPPQRRPRDRRSTRARGPTCRCEFALANLERRLIVSGVTTEFHAISFMNNARAAPHCRQRGRARRLHRRLRRVRPPARSTTRSCTGSTSGRPSTSTWSSSRWSGWPCATSR